MLHIDLQFAQPFISAFSWRLDDFSLAVHGRYNKKLSFFSKTAKNCSSNGYNLSLVR